jgi:hypothetical protein
VNDWVTAGLTTLTPKIKVALQGFDTKGARRHAFDISSGLTAGATNRNHDNNGQTA